MRHADNISGYVKFDESFFTGVFAPLKDPHFFREVTMEHGAVTWAGELDLVPDAMYEEILKHGQWLLKD